MNFIGQHIQSLIARFRASVFLKNLESSSETTALVVDSNGKITKNASLVSSGTTDLTSDVTGVLPVANGGTGVSSLAADNILTGNGTGAITAEAYFTYSTSDEELIIGNPDNGDAKISRRNSSGTNNTGGDLILQAGPATGNAQGGGFKFYSSTAGSSGSAVQSSNEIASINYSGNLQIDGGLTTGSTLALSNIGKIQVANQSLITGLGTITSGTWNASTIGVEYGGTGQTTLASNSILTGNGTSGITAESNLTYDGTNLTLTSDGVAAPDLIIESTASHSTAGNLFFNKFRADDTPPDGMMIGLINWNSEDDANNAQVYASIIGSAEETGSGAEGGKLQFRIATHDGELQDGIVIEDGDAEDEIDVTIGSSATSVTTVLGTLTMGSTAFADTHGVIQVATQGNIDHDSLANFVANEHIDWTASSVGTIHPSNISTLNQDTTGNADTATNLTSGDKTLAGIITMKGLIADGDRSVTAGGDGVALHVDAMDITDSSTSASGTAGFYNHVVFENPRILATNSSVTTTNASTLYIKGAPVASTNQTITNAYSIYVVSGGSYFGGAIAANGGVIGDVTGDVTGNVSGSSGSCTGNAATATNLVASTSTAVQLGTIELGHASDTTIARSAAGTVTIEGNEIQTTNKHRHFINIGVNLAYSYARYLPWGSYYIFEQNTDSNPEYTTYVAPHDGKFLKLVLRAEVALGSTVITIYKVGDGTEEPDQGSTVDTQTVDIASANTAYTYTFDSDATFSAGDAMSCKIDPAGSSSISGSPGVVGTFAMEFDLTT